MAVDDPDTNLKAETHFMIQSCCAPRIKAMRYHSITASCFALAAISAAMGQQFADVNQKEEIKPIAPPTDASLIDAKYRNASLPIEERIDDLLPRLSMEEKAELLHGASTFTYGRIPRIGLAEFGMFDGPQGVRLEEGKPSTALPCGIAMAATWNRELVRLAGKVPGEETRAAHGRVILGPGINMMRTPLGARSFEYFGEDPYLAGMTAAGYINGVQGEGVAVCAKHWVLNDQEWARTVMNVDTDERSLREIYARPFQIAIDNSNPWSIMTSYNLVRGQYPSHNKKLNTLLYDELKWDGALVSDWGAWHGDVPAINGGCTLEMPSGKNAGKDRAIAKAVQEGRIDRNMFDAAVRRNLRLLFRIGAFDRATGGPANTPQQADIARRIAEEAVVLLKNDQNILPLSRDKVNKIAVIGPNADQYHTMADGSTLHTRGGSGAIRGTHEITPLKAIVDLFGEENVLYAPGFRFEEPKIRSCPNLKEMDPVDAAKQADIVLFFGGTDHTYDKEKLGWGVLPDSDKPDLDLKGKQAELIARIIEANPSVIVALTVGAPVQMEEWIDQVPAVLVTWYGGQEAGTAASNIIFGKANPSGKLPQTFGKKLEDWLSHSTGTISYPGVIEKDANGHDKRPEQRYGDGIWVGYRHFDKAGIAPRFPFGYGLSYTTFSFDKKNSGNKDTFEVIVTNTGKKAGAEVVQCYLSKPDGQAQMPVRELAGYEKVFLNPGESRTVSFTLTDKEKRFWNEQSGKWEIPSGTYRISIGNSSRNLPVTYTFAQ